MKETNAPGRRPGLRRDGRTRGRRSTRPVLARPALTVLAVLAMVASGCNGDDPAADPTTSAATGGSTAATTDAGDPTPTPEPTTAATSTTTEDAASPPATEGATTPAQGATGGGLPGEDFISIWQEGDLLAVVGVAHDDVLNVRSVPGTGGDIVATADPTADDLEATGRARSLPRSIWAEVTVDGATGWVHSSFIAYLGGTDDVTSQYRDMDRRMGARTMRRLGRIVARGFAVSGPEVTSRIVRVVAPSHGDLSEVTYDVIGLGDDSVGGLRLHVFAQKRPNRPGFSLRTIEQTLLCSRSSDGESCG